MKLQVWHIPQIPGKPFTVPVSSVAEGVRVMDILANYDLFQYKNNIKGDYSNASGLSMFEDGLWIDWCNDETDDPRVFVGNELSNREIGECDD